MNPLPDFVHAGALRLAYETQGPRDGVPVLLVHGLGQQLTGWPDALVAMLAQAGYRVIRFDNRDVGKSSRLRGRPSLGWLYLRARVGLPGAAPYRLDDLAHDTVSLIDQLCRGPVHLVGASMGGMVAQIVAARFPAAVRSLCSIMSSSGERGLPQARADVMQLMMKAPRAGASLEQVVAHGVALWERIGSPDYPTPRSRLELKVRRDLARNGADAGGADRQFAAILASGSRVPLLAQVLAPTLVLHGEADPLVPPEAGRSTARHIPGALFEGIPGMGHDFPDALLPRLAERLIRHFRFADRAAAGDPAPAQPGQPHITQGAWA